MRDRNSKTKESFSNLVKDQSGDLSLNKLDSNGKKPVKNQSLKNSVERMTKYKEKLEKLQNEKKRSGSRFKDKRSRDVSPQNTQQMNLTRTNLQTSQERLEKIKQERDDQRMQQIQQEILAKRKADARVNLTSYTQQFKLMNNGEVVKKHTNQGNLLAAKGQKHIVDRNKEPVLAPFARDNSKLNQSQASNKAQLPKGMGKVHKIGQKKMINVNQYQANVAYLHEDESIQLQTKEALTTVKSDTAGQESPKLIQEDTILNIRIQKENLDGKISPNQTFKASDHKIDMRNMTNMSGLSHNTNNRYSNHDAERQLHT